MEFKKLFLAMAAQKYDHKKKKKYSLRKILIQFFKFILKVSVE